MREYDLYSEDNSSQIAEARPATDTIVVRSRFLAVSVLAAIAGMVGLGFVHPFGDPRSEPGKGLGALLAAGNVPADARAVLVEKCADCHSNETRWPIYARIAPGSWLIERDIVEGRRNMDLSRWDELPQERQELLAAKMVQEARSGKMPPLQYLALHWSAGLSSADVQALAAMSMSAVEGSVSGSGDADHGKAVFEKRCAGCHTMAKNKDGPALAGVFGRKAASAARFDYSPALKKSGLTWTDANLDKWLADPDVLVPGNTMEYRVGKAEERRDLIAYLRQ
jgi:cytochrome c